MTARGVSTGSVTAPGLGSCMRAPGAPGPSQQGPQQGSVAAEGEGHVNICLSCPLLVWRGRQQGGGRERGRDHPRVLLQLWHRRVAVINGFVLSGWPSRDHPWIAIMGLGKPTRTACRGGPAGGMGWALCGSSLHGPVPSLGLDTLSSLSQALVTGLISGRKEQGMATKHMAAVRHRVHGEGGTEECFF